MGLTTKIVLVILVLVAIAHFLPGAYDSGREWTLEKISSATNDKVGSVIEQVTDFTNYDCDTDLNCVEHFKIDGLQCSSVGLCSVGGIENE